MSNYYLIQDNSMGYFSAICILPQESAYKDKTREYWKPIAMMELDRAINGPIFSNIWSRELHFRDRWIGNESYGGWSISEREYNIIKEIIGLYPSVIKYNKLINF